MPMSQYVSGLRAHVGNRLLLLPGVTAVLRRAGEFLLPRQRDTPVLADCDTPDHAGSARN